MAKPVPIDDMFDDLTEKQKLIKLGEEMIGLIIERTQEGYGVNGDFDPYVSNTPDGSMPYWKRKQLGKFKRQSLEHRPSDEWDVNLTLTNDMLNSLKVKMNKTTDTQVTIGFSPANAVKANAQEKRGRAISTSEKPITDMEEKFIADFFDKEIKESMSKSDGKTEIIIG